MKWLLLIIVFSRCPATTSIEYKTLAECKHAQDILLTEWEVNHIDASATCLSQ